MLEINIYDIERLQKAMNAYAGNIETAINDVLHNEGGALIEESVQRLIPVSGRKPWKGKKSAAKESKSLRHHGENLSVIVRTEKKYQYLYFPDDGSSTKKHFGNQRFFARGADAATNDIIERCVAKLTNDFEKGV